MKELLQNKKVLMGIGAVVIIILIGIVAFSLFKKEPPIVDIGDSMNEQAPDKNEEQLQLHYIITRNTKWGDEYDSILNAETGNILDYQKGKYITVDYENLFDVKFLPTYIFNGGKLAAIIYECDLSAEELDKISLLHNDFAVNVHYVYENLYRENNKWSSGQARKYDTNLWSNAILDGKLTLQSIWNSNEEKVFLLTGQNSYFKFLEKNKERVQNPSMSFVVIADDYLTKNNFNDLIKVKPDGY